MLRGLGRPLRRRDDAAPLVLMFTGATTAIGLMYGAGFFFTARRTSPSWSTGAGGSSTSGSRASSRSSPRRRSPSSSRKLGLVDKKHAGAAVIASSRALPLRRHPRHVPPPLLQRHADLDPGRRRELQRARGRPAGAHRPRGVPDQPAADRRRRGWPRYRWPIRFFVGVAFWNLVGAGVFGFLINPPIALYYMQGLNTTPVHAHTALFGVYGLLSLGLVLSSRASSRATAPGRRRRSRSPSGR